MTTDIRIFIGFVLSKGLNMHLHQNPKWEEAKFTKETVFIETNCQEKTYIGRFIPKGLTCDELKKKELEVREQLQIYCPKLNLDKHSVYLFSQLFIS